MSDIISEILTELYNDIVTLFGLQKTSSTQSSTTPSTISKTPAKSVQTPTIQSTPSAPSPAPVSRISGNWQDNGITNNYSSVLPPAINTYVPSAIVPNNNIVSGGIYTPAPAPSPAPVQAPAPAPTPSRLSPVQSPSPAPSRLSPVQSPAPSLNGYSPSPASSYGPSPSTLSAGLYGTSGGGAGGTSGGGSSGGAGSPGINGISPSSSLSSINPQNALYVYAKVDQNGPDYTNSMTLPDGRVVFIPGYEHNLGVFDPTTNKFDKIPVSQLTSPDAYSGNSLLSTISNSNKLPVYIQFNLRFPKYTPSTFNDIEQNTLLNIYSILLTRVNINGTINILDIVDGSAIVKLVVTFNDGNVSNATLLSNSLPNTIPLIDFMDANVNIDFISPILTSYPTKSALGPSGAGLGPSGVGLSSSGSSLGPSGVGLGPSGAGLTPSTRLAPSGAGLTPSTAGSSLTPSTAGSSLIPAAAGSSLTPSTSLGPSAAGSSGISKKGFVVGNRDTTTGTTKVNSLNVGWYYTWGYEPISPPPSNIKFTPMIWNIANIQLQLTTIINNLKTLNIPNQEDILLGYNEPDGTNTGAQANMTVGQAVQYWPLLVSTNRRLGSPVMYGSLTNPPTDAPGTGKNANNTPQPSGITGTVSINISNNPNSPNIVALNPLIWLDNFLIQVSQDYIANPSKYTVRGPFPDFICVHWYGVPHDLTFLNYLTAINNKYKLPIWVTEYSVADWNTTFDSTTNTNTHTANYDWSYPTTQNISTNATAQFMRSTMDGMNKMPFVERYSWKERYLLAYPGPSPASANYPIPPGVTPDTIMSSANPDVMNQSALFQSYIHFPTTMPPLTPLGNLYSNS